MENRVYGLVVKVFPELALRRDLLLRRKLDEKFAMKDIDFKSVKFRDNLEFMAITEDQDVIEGWRVDSGQMKSADARFNPAWTEPRLKKYSEFPLEDYGSTEGVCKSRLREKRLKEMGQTLA
ncbi:hypothetical protein FRC03_003064 [Tulasnella sp. 419]|nr:hypothetical protein FRC03_003064 [Tulasnella sp. 419]